MTVKVRLGFYVRLPAQLLNLLCKHKPNIEYINRIIRNENRFFRYTFSTRCHGHKRCETWHVIFRNTALLHVIYAHNTQGYHCTNIYLPLFSILSNLPHLYAPRNNVQVYQCCWLRFVKCKLVLCDVRSCSIPICLMYAATASNWSQMLL